MTTHIILSNNKDLIFRQWLDRVKEEMPEVRRHSKSAIENSLPALFDALVAALGTSENERVLYYGKDHGLRRADFQEYSLHHIVREYRLLKKTMFEVIDQHEVVAPPERDLIMDAVDEAIQEACETFYRVKNSVQVNARKLAEQKADQLKIDDEKREEFIFSLSHDLNNPLTNIKACIDLLERDPDPNQVKKIMSILTRSVFQAETLVKDFLNLGEVDSARELPLQKQEVNVLSEISNELEAYKVSERAEVALISSQEKLHAEVDISLLLRAVNNLVNNALQHSNGKSAVKVICETDNNELVIKVHNTGSHIEPEVKERIFDRFYHSGSANHGWGLGLSFVKKVVECHDGKVSVESEEDSGTTFTLQIPMAATPA